MNYPKNIIMVSPEYFDVVYQINDHMNLQNKVDKALAMAQWGVLKSAYEKLGFNVIVAPGDERFPDMVFAANQIFSTPNKIFLSQMKHAERKGEVEYLKSFLNLDHAIQVNSGFESMGDLLWDYDGERLFGGHGFRTELSAYEEIENHIDFKIISLELVSSNFYHLDTCLSIINKDTALFVESAFNQNGIDKLNQNFSNLIKVDEAEAKDSLACNAHCPDGKNILVEKGAVILQESCREAGLNVVTVDTSEYLKSGGSIFCMKNQGWF